ncbi:hypothetical protein R0131_10670 [Clostridium sp. AL.422]|uniref:hypothetical protein n=1 Tax=Clostridium TaxID=1485 RepID=UPI00293DAA08|nr:MULTISPECIES: hypothetical protein [unclassified Clostridium]MDV4151305.1 hypothetical protein [Clostridium sp. AL.422]
MKKKSFLIALAIASLLVGCGSKTNDDNGEINNNVNQNNEEVSNNEIEEVDHKYEKTLNKRLGVEITYPSDILSYNDNSNQSNSISFIGEIEKTVEIPNIFLAISTSEYDLKDTEEGLKLQAFSENIETEDVIIGKESISARKIKVSEENNQGRIVYYYVFQREDDKTTYIIEVDTVSDEKGIEKYIDEFEKVLNSFIFIGKEDIQENTEEVRNTAMGFSFSVSEDFFSKLISSGTNTSYSKEFKADLDEESYYVNISDIKQDLFTIYRITKKYTENEIKDINPNMVYLGSNSNATFTIMYAEKPDDSLSDKGSGEFFTLIENEVPSVAKSFVIE